MNTRILVSLLALLSPLGGLVTAEPLGTAFTYQGQLTDGGQPGQGIYDLRFTIYDAAADGNVVGGPLTNASDALLGPIFAAPDTPRYVEIGPLGSGNLDPKYTTSQAYLKDYKIILPANGIGKWTATFRVVGGMTRGTYT